jgi:hypothetical protein
MRDARSNGMDSRAPYLSSGLVEKQSSMSDYFFPRLQAVETLQPYRLRTVWRTGEVLELDVGERLKKHQALKPLLQPEVFAKVHQFSLRHVKL